LFLQFGHVPLTLSHSRRWGACATTPHIGHSSTFSLCQTGFLHIGQVRCSVPHLGQNFPPKTGVPQTKHLILRLVSIRIFLGTLFPPIEEETGDCFSRCFVGVLRTISISHSLTVRSASFQNSLNWSVLRYLGYVPLHQEQMLVFSLEPLRSRFHRLLRILLKENVI